MKVLDSSRKRKKPGIQSTLDGFITKGRENTDNSLGSCKLEPKEREFRITEGPKDGLIDFSTAAKVVQERKLRTRRSSLLRWSLHFHQWPLGEYSAIWFSIWKLESAELSVWLVAILSMLRSVGWTALKCGEIAGSYMPGNYARWNPYLSFVPETVIG